MDLRTLAPGDEETLERFLVQYPDTTMFLRSNLRAAGIEDHGQRYQGTYVGAFEDGRLVGVAAHYWNGNVIMEAPRHLEPLVQAAVKHSGRDICGLIGRYDQTEVARRVLRLRRAAAAMDSREHLYALDLERLVVPVELTQGRVRCRRPRADEIELLVQWRIDFSVASLGETESKALREHCRKTMQNADKRGDHWVLEADGQPVSYSAFNAKLPECVQIGGVWTPPEHRSRGYARCVVAGSLLDARAEGVRRSILFTNEDNVPAQRSYEALGYVRIGDYGLVLFKRGHRPR